MGDQPTTDTSDWTAIANRVREGRMYLCFEEPEDPYGYAEIDNDGGKRDKGWAAICTRDHPEMGCGWFEFKRSEERAP